MKIRTVEAKDLAYTMDKHDLIAEMSQRRPSSMLADTHSEWRHYLNLYNHRLLKLRIKYDKV